MYKGGGGGGGGGWGVTAVTASHVVSELGPLHGTEEGSGHHLTFELSPGRNVDLLTN